MPKEKYICGLDIGTYKVAVLQGKLDPEGGVSIVGAASELSSGIRRGVIVDLEEVVSCVSKCLERVERMTGSPVTEAVVALGGSHVSALQSRGVIAVSKPDGEITESDIQRVVDASQAVSIPPNREVLQVLARQFTIDGQEGIKEPLGMTGIRLEVDSLLVHAGAPYVRNLQRALLQAGVEPVEFVPGALAAAESVLTRRQKELGVALVDLGAGTTSVAVFEESTLLHVSVLPVGQMHLTNDLAIGLQCRIETAEQVKLQYGHAGQDGIDKHLSVDLARIDEAETGHTNRGVVVEIMEARLDELFDMVAKELKKIDRAGKLPAGVVLTGGGSNLPGIVEYAKQRLRLPVSLGELSGMRTIIDKVEDPSFAVCAGLVVWGARHDVSGGFGFGQLPKLPLDKMKRWFKSFLP